MSFSTDVKKELLSIELLSDCCSHAQAYGLLLFGRSFSNSNISFAAENKIVSDKYAECVENITGHVPEYSYAEGKMAIVSVKTSLDRRKLLSEFGHSADQFSLRINRANISDDCCFFSFVRGVFLACGTVSSPEKNYHLEFVIPFLKLSNDLYSLLQEMGFEPKHVLRKGYHVIYFKDSESIEDLLTSMGATNSTLRLIGVKIQKDMRNRINRRVNFETANISRAVNAGGIQVDAIRKIEKEKGIDFLSPGLREVALLRLENPSASLNEMEELLEGKLSKSGINHRLNRIVKIAEEI